MRQYLLLWVLFISLQSTFAQLKPLVDSIPMSDGRKLAADIYIPSGMSSGPVILIQTPYNRQLMRLTGLPLGVGMNLNSSNYIYVVTDWRGFYGSRTAAYLGSPDRGADGYSTVEWIASQSWSDGKVGTWGPSALGKVQYQTAKTKPPHLVCICPVVGAPQFEYQEYFPNGVIRTEYVEQLDALGYGLSTGLMQHPYYDNYWTVAESANNYPQDIQVPALMIGGWYDHNINLMLDFYKSIRTSSPVNVRDKHKLLMGPWVHGGHGAVKVGSSTQGQLSYPNALNDNDTFALRFFDFYLRNVQNSWEQTPAVTYYTLGENKWKTAQNWPPVSTLNKNMYLNKAGALDYSLPGSTTDTACYTYDPQNPSMTIGGCTLRNDLLQGPYDQSVLVEGKQGVLSFSTPVLTEPLLINGQVTVSLKVSSDRTDTDFDIRMTDVYPDGKSMLINDEAFRMRFRNGFTKALESFMTPGNVYTCNIQLPYTCISIQPGHRLRIIVSSSNYPKYNRNMNNGNNMYPGNSLDSLLNPSKAFNTLCLNSANPSMVTLPLEPSSGIEGVKYAELTKIYPQPCHDLLHVDGLWIGSAYSLCDLNGRVLISGEVSGTIDVSSLAEGFYLLNINNSNGTVATAKVIKH